MTEIPDFYQWLDHLAENLTAQASIDNTMDYRGGNPAAFYPVAAKANAKANIYKSLMTRGDRQSAADVYRSPNKNSSHYSYDYDGDDEHIFGHDNHFLGKPQPVSGGSNHSKPTQNQGNLDRTAIVPRPQPPVMTVQDYLQQVHMANAPKR